MSHDHDHGTMPMPMSPDSMYNNSMNMNDMAMHMNFFWGKDVVVLFDGWPNGRLGMYILALAFVFLLAVAVEILAAVPIKPRMRPLSGGLLQAAVYAVRMALAYLIMLSVMSFNVGIFIVAVAGHAVGCFIVKYRAIAAVYMAANDAPKV
ncbi:copper transporter 6-like [Olea europaea subsp. europaea]|uniref:Copper transport protein n=1 Tax=Olea europaea subsp. europaea TaxID=158383 RepID=A0A8S0SHE0_OLEEU|nr:copper transporter 6-like [Olea europaea subsp. europaea]